MYTLTIIMCNIDLYTTHVDLSTASDIKFLFSIRKKKEKNTYNNKLKINFP